MRLMHVLLVITLAVSMAPISLAQSTQQAQSVSVPRLVNINGTFRPADGQPHSPVEAITLSIYAEQEGGTPLWQETQSVAIDANGRYSVLLGATHADGIPPEVFAGDAQWFGVVFARSGEVEGPRVRLTSVPYALRSANADTLGGLPASAYLLAPAGSSDSLNATEGTTNSGGITPLGVLPGITNFLSKFVNSVDVGTSGVFENAGMVGVGTTSPLDVMHVRLTNTAGTMTGYAVQNLGATATSYSGMLFYDHTGALGQFQGFNNITKEYRINNIAPNGSINFMIGSTSRFLVRNDGDIELSGSIRKGGTLFAHNRETGTTALGLGAAAAGGMGINNTAVGIGALAALNTGENTAIGARALGQSTGIGNIALGSFAGFNLTSGSNNIYIGHQGVASESATTRIAGGRVFISGIRGATTGVADAVAVVIDSSGQLGTINSSRRYKEDIQDMGDASSGLMKLRPVTYRYTQAYADGRKPIDYGLIAEEVEQVYPDLVAHLKNGEVETVQYQKINAMLLNEVQKQHRTIEDLTARLAALERLLTPEKQ